MGPILSNVRFPLFHGHSGLRVSPDGLTLWNGFQTLSATAFQYSNADVSDYTMRVIHAVAQKCRAMTVEMVAANVSSGRR